MADENSSAEPERESGCGVLGVFFALLLFLGSIAGLWLIRASPARAGDILGELFEMGEVPFGLSVAHAAVLPSGERFVRWQDPAAEPEEEPKVEQGGKAPSAEGENPPSPKPPAEPPPQKERGKPPREVVLVNYPRSGLESVQNAMRVGGGGMGRDGPMGPPGGPGGGFFSGGQGDRVAMDAGQLAWGDLLVRYVHERNLLGPRGFRDIVRVNLSVGGRYCVLLLRWSLNYPASLERTEELIQVFAPLSTEERKDS